MLFRSQSGGGAFAAARLTDNTQGLSLEHREVNAVDGSHDAAAPSQQVWFEGEVLDQATHVQDGLTRTHDQFLISIAERKPSLSRLKAIEVMKIIAPGNAATQGWV